jgi:2-polyprenyl-6-methoxyphenol hydroxylase-like FAD-dependent oxidoreductase
MAQGHLDLNRLRTRIAIIGAGIGGLALALECHARKLPCLVFEAAPALAPLGVGINVLPHSVRALRRLGLLDELKSSAIETAELAFFNRHGQLIWREARGIAAGYDFPQLSIHRGELQMILLKAALDRLGQGTVLTGHTLESFTTGDESASARAMLTTRNGPVEVEADVLVAADGIHSTVRSRLYPDEGPPAFSGRLLWRGTCLAPPFLTGRSMIQAGHARQKAVVYPISRRTFESSGDNLTNWIMELAVEGTAPPRQEWNRRVDKSVFAPRFATWQWPWLNVPDLIERGGEAFEFPMCDRDPLPRWTFGRTTLLGDAAHPMYPIGSNGASQAILDAECLVESLVANNDALDALRAYESLRRPATAQIVLANRGNGPDQVMQIAEERAPNGFDDIETVIPRAELESIAARYKQTAGFSREQVNGR